MRRPRNALCWSWIYFAATEVGTGRGGYRSYPREMIVGIRKNGQLDWPLFLVVEEDHDVTLSQIADCLRHAAQRIWHSLRPCSSGSEIAGMVVDVSRSDGTWSSRTRCFDTRSTFFVEAKSVPGSG